MFDRNKWQKAYRRANCNKSTHKYERGTPKGFLMRVYRNMKSRVTGVQKREAHFYVGLALLPKDEFYQWALADDDFQSLWRAWQQSGRVNWLTPSIDRRDVKIGYILSNMQWITQAANSGKLMRRNTTTRARGAAWHAARHNEDTYADS